MATGQPRKTELVRTPHEHYIRLDVVEDGNVVFSVGFPPDDEEQGIRDLLEDAGFTWEEYQEHQDEIMLKALRQIFMNVMMSLI